MSHHSTVVATSYSTPKLVVDRRNTWLQMFRLMIRNEYCDLRQVVFIIVDTSCYPLILMNEVSCVPMIIICKRRGMVRIGSIKDEMTPAWVLGGK